MKRCGFVVVVLVLMVVLISPQYVSARGTHLHQMLQRLTVQ